MVFEGEKKESNELFLLNGMEIKIKTSTRNSSVLVFFRFGTPPTSNPLLLSKQFSADQRLAPSLLLSSQSFIFRIISKFVFVFFLGRAEKVTS